MFKSNLIIDLNQLNVIETDINVMYALQVIMAYTIICLCGSYGKPK